MPELDGYRFCLALRRDPQLASIPVVLTSGIRVSPADQDLARKVGAQALVPRTPGFREVLDTVAALRRLPTGSPRSASGKPAITDAGGLDAAEIDRATVGMFRLTPDGRPIAVNPALALILDYAGPEELMAAWSAFPDILVDRERGQEFLRGCNDPEGISGFEADARTRAGRVIRIVARGRALRDEDGLPCWLQCVVEDITTSNPVE
jgi:PAS domain-containing protein